MLTDRLLFAVVSAALIVTVVSDTTGYEEDYIYDEDYDWYEEPQPSLNPQFITEAQEFKVQPGHTISLPCKVDKLGPMVISWKKKKPKDGKDSYLATGDHLMVYEEEANRFSIETIPGQGSNLVIALARAEDIGDYVCEVSSNPPASLRHTVSIIVPPQVEILRPEYKSRVANESTDSEYDGEDDREIVEAPREEIQLHRGDELALVCRGSGDPLPRISWTRKGKHMPDGRRHIDGNEIVYKNVSRKHSGHYVCTGKNGPGVEAHDSIRVDVLHPPEIITEESYIQNNGSVQLELLCIVHASPKAQVTWHKDGKVLHSIKGSMGMGILSKVLPQRLKIAHHGKKHILVIDDLQAHDRGIYTCHAINELGESKGNIKVLDIPTSFKRSKSSAEETFSEPMADRSKGSEPMADRAMGALSLANSMTVNLLTTISSFLVCISLQHL